MTNRAYEVLVRYKAECNRLEAELGGRAAEWEVRCDAIWKDKYEPEYIWQNQQAEKLAVTRTAIDNGIRRIERYLMNKYGCDAARRDLDPLRRWIDTGRASANLIRLVLMAKPFMIGRLLHKGGSYDEAVKRVIQYVSPEGSAVCMKW